MPNSNPNRNKADSRKAAEAFRKRRLRRQAAKVPEEKTSSKQVSTRKVIKMKSGLSIVVGIVVLVLVLFCCISTLAILGVGGYFATRSQVSTYVEATAPTQTTIVRETAVPRQLVVTDTIVVTETVILTPTAALSQTETLTNAEVNPNTSISLTPPYTVTNSFVHGSWTVQTTDRFEENPIVKGWLNRMKDPAPLLWKTFPNIPNKDVPEFRTNGKQVPDGLEYGTYSSPYCFAHPCDIPVGAWEYRYISGDYRFLGMECKGNDGSGCMLILINVMDESYTWRAQDVDNGFTLRGRYFNGDALEWGIWGLVSNGSANMLNLPTMAHEDEVLNAGDPGNSGANCGNTEGCKTVSVTIVVHAGDAVIAVAKATVTR